MKEFKRLFCDIEIAPCLGYFFRTGKQNVYESQILEHPTIICIAYRWEHSKKGKVLYWDNNQDDKQLVEDFREIAKEADVVIGHNSEGFDIKWIATRLCWHSSFRLNIQSSEDTYRQARRNLYLPSYKLNYLARWFGIGTKLSEGWADLIVPVWREKDDKALAKMGKYCLQDVDLALEVWKRLYPYVDHKTNYATLNLNPELCPQCGSSNTKKNGTRRSKVGLYQNFLCNNCGSSFKDGKNLIKNSAEYLR